MSTATMKVIPESPVGETGITPDRNVFFDIETAPLPEEKLRETYQEKSPEEFAATCNKRWGKDAVAKHYQKYKETAWQEYIDRAALSALTGQVVAIGYGQWSTARMSVWPQFSAGPQGEPAILRTFWEIWDRKEAHSCLVGFASSGFDLPFLIRRSWHHSIEIPFGVMEKGRVQGRFIDLLDIWRCGLRQEYISLGVLSCWLGFSGKSEDCDAASFHKLLASVNEDDRRKAASYLVRDVELTAMIGRQFGY